MSRKGENIYKRKDGRWEGRYKKGLQASGKWAYGYVYASSYREVKQKLAAINLEAASTPKQAMKQKSIALRDLLAEWLVEKRPRIKGSSYNKYHNLAHSYLLPTLGDVLLDQITYECIESFCNTLLTSGGSRGSGLSAKTVNDTLSVLRQVLRYADARGYHSASSVTHFSVKREEKELRVLSMAEQELLCSYLIEHLEPRNLGILLCLFTGIRIGELCALTWEDISCTEQTVRIHCTMQRVQTGNSEEAKTQVVISTPKSLCSIRTIPLTKEISMILQCNRGTGYFLTGSKDMFVEPRTMQNHFKRVLQASGIEPANFHSLRHSFATRCIELGFDVKSLSEILGHASVNITMNRYVHPSMKLKRQNMQLLSQLITVK